MRAADSQHAPTHLGLAVPANVLSAWRFLTEAGTECYLNTLKVARAVPGASVLLSEQQHQNHRILVLTTKNSMLDLLDKAQGRLKVLGEMCKASTPGTN